MSKMEVYDPDTDKWRALTEDDLAGLGGGSSPVTTWTPDSVTLTSSTSATLLAANANRIRFQIHNPLATTLYVRFAASAATASAGGYDIAIPTDQTYISDSGEYAGEIRGICATAGDVSVSEGV